MPTLNIMKRPNIFRKESLNLIFIKKKQLISWKIISNHLLQFGQTSMNNSVELFKLGDFYFKNLWHNFRHARFEILFECYILKNDQVSLRTIQELIAASKRGVSVTTVIDGIGGNGIPKYLKKELENSGVNLKVYNPMNRKYIHNAQIIFFSNILTNRRNLLFRNHKKTIVIDKKVAFIGGMNVTNEYCSSLIRSGVNQFRDTHARIYGPAVLIIRKNYMRSLIDIYPNTSTQDYFEQNDPLKFKIVVPHKLIHIPNILMKVNTKRKKKIKKSLDTLDRITEHFKKIERVPNEQNHIIQKKALGFYDGITVQILQSSRKKNEKTLQISFQNVLRASMFEIKITNPYFVPPYTLTKEICFAARRGVNIKIITCGESDVPIMACASRHTYSNLLANGVRIFEYEKRILHGKTMIIDHLFSTLGSFNFDDWSYERNWETNILMYDTLTAKQLNQHFNEDVINCFEITRDNMEVRLELGRAFNWIAYQIARFPKVLLYNYYTNFGLVLSFQTSFSP